MELWIRSQDKKQLIKCENITVINNWIMVNNELRVGYFDVLKNGEQRALEVLDEIQEILIDYSTMSRVVYQVPEE